MKKLLLYTVAIFGITSCTKQIPFDDPGAESKIAISCFLDEADSISVVVSKSASILRPNDIERIEDADLELFENGISVGSLTPDLDFVYRLDFAPVQGNNYEIKASANGLEDVSSTTTIPNAVTATNAAVNEAVSVDQDVYRLTFDIDDPSGDNYYIVYVVQEYWPGEYQTQSFTSTEPTFLGGSGDNYFWNGAAFRDDSFDGQIKKFTLDLDYFNGEPDFPTSVLLVSATEEFFNYFVTYEAYQSTTGDPFAQPVQIYSNVENGLGIFAGLNRSLTVIE